MARKNENMIAALLRERDGYEQRGLTDRVAEVDAQLEHYGYDDEDGPKGRRSAPRQTADGGRPAAKKTAAKKTTAAKPDAPEPQGPAAEQPPAE
ncbi:hypothetical protein [Streptomyces olivaceoviridis]|uniref:hypothetical protein n=1 Tax=Streptomyces olivaceoviridis TaxID=1921 RepID=UPI003703524D